MVRKYCCCFETNLSACKGVAIVLIVFRLIHIAYCLKNIIELNELPDESNFWSSKIEKIKKDNGIALGCELLGLITDICLYYGSTQKISTLLWIWFTVAGILTIAVIYGIVYWIIDGVLSNLAFIIVSVISGGLNIWMMLAVYGGIEEIRYF